MPRLRTLLALLFAFTSPSIAQDRFAWIAEDASLAIVDVRVDDAPLPPADPSAPSFLIEIELGTERQAPELEIGLTSTDSDDDAWSFTLQPRPRQRTVRVQAPAGDYRLSVEAKGRALSPRAGVTVSIPADPAPLTLWTLIPRISGDVVSSDGAKPVQYAEIENAQGELLAVTDAKGRFTIDDLDSPATRELRISAPGFGARWIQLPPRPPSAGSIRLYPGYTLQLRVDVTGATEPLPIVANIRGGAAHGGRILGTAKSRTGERMELPDLPSGTHRIHIAGAGPWQHVTREVEVVADIEQTIVIEPIDVQGSVTHGRNVLAAGRVELKGGQGVWNGSVDVGDDGTFREELWDPGDLAAIVSANELPSPYVEMLRGTEDSPRYLDIRIPATLLQGKVRHESRPVPDASVKLTSVSGETRYSRSAGTDADGSFEIAGLPEGKHTITASAEGFLPTTVAMESTASDDTKEVAIDLVKGNEITLHVKTSDGRRVEFPMVAIGATPDGIRPEREIAGSAGMVRLVLEEGAAKQILVLDRAGGFASATVRAGDAAEQNIVIPPSTGAIVLQVNDEAGKPVEGVGVVVRYNGHLIPIMTLYALLDGRGNRPTSGAEGQLMLSRLPAGRYELFPWRDPKARNAILASHLRYRPAVDFTLDGRSTVPLELTVK